MVKPELGLKRVCVACGAKFYDLLKSPAVCPKCGTEQPADMPKPRRAGGNVTDEKRPKKPPVADDAEAEAETSEDETEEDALEDAADLEEEADAIPDEIEVEPETDERER